MNGRPIVGFQHDKDQFPTFEILLVCYVLNTRNHCVETGIFRRGKKFAVRKRAPIHLEGRDDRVTGRAALSPIGIFASSRMRGMLPSERNDPAHNLWRNALKDLGGDLLRGVIVRVRENRVHGKACALHKPRSRHLAGNSLNLFAL
jgi:hypothetical protein